MCRFHWLESADEDGPSIEVRMEKILLFGDGWLVFSMTESRPTCWWKYISALKFIFFNFHYWVGFGPNSNVGPQTGLSWNAEAIKAWTRVGFSWPKFSIFSHSSCRRGRKEREMGLDPFFATAPQRERMEAQWRWRDRNGNGLQSSLWLRGRCKTKMARMMAYDSKAWRCWCQSEVTMVLGGGL